MNTPVQGLAADCLKLAMGRLVKTLADKPYIRPVMTVHDSLVFEVRADHVDEAAALVKGCMEALPPLENFMPLVGVVHQHTHGDDKSRQRSTVQPDTEERHDKQCTSNGENK